jgi:hypothetical protein
LVRLTGIIVVVILLTIPTIVTYFLKSDEARLGVILVSIMMVATFLALLTQTRRVEVFVGTAT